MSKIYDDLKREEGKSPPRQDDVDRLDLFAFAKAKHGKPVPEKPPPELPAPKLDGLFRATGLSPLKDIGSKARTARRPSSLIIAAVCGVIALGILALGVTRALHRAGTTGEGAEPKAAVAAPHEVARARPRAERAAERRRRPAVTAAVPGNQPTSARPAAQPAAIPALKLDLPGVRVTAEAHEQVVVFQSGLFVSGHKLSREAEGLLAQTGRQLAPYRTNILITVVGCTDNVRITQSSKYKDNEELGRLRAWAAIRYLQSQTGLPASAFKMITYGTKWSPYPNDTPENRARNRTVVLRISVR